MMLVSYIYANGKNVFFKLTYELREARDTYCKSFFEAQRAQKWY